MIFRNKLSNRINLGIKGSMGQLRCVTIWEQFEIS
jgi:hypothetical protein